MTESFARPERVHMVGSIALDSVEEVFRTCGQLLGRRLRRLPDGEPGGRRLWISWQYPLLRASPYLVPKPANTASGQQSLELAPGVDPDQIRFGELGYCREARISHQDFRAAQARGEIPAGVKFQVSLPTPLAVISPFVPGPDMQGVLAAYTKSMVKEAQDICAAIPHAELAIQWDVCIEMIAWDGRSPMAHRFPGWETVIPQSVGQLCDAIPADVEVGIHLCYGDFDGKHFIEPIDAERMVSLANAITDAAQRPLAWVHMPVPANRDDDAFFAPLEDLRLDPGGELYLGLVHGDGQEATDRRIAAASRHVQGFGVATECGIARQRTPEKVEALIRAHAEAAREPAG